MGCYFMIWAANARKKPHSYQITESVEELKNWSDEI